MQDIEKSFTKNFSSFEQIEGQPVARGMNDWAVPWADLMMVMFVLFVVLFIYASTHQDVKVLFSQSSAEKAQASSTLDPLMGLIGQIASRADTRGSKEIIRMAENQVLYRSRADGVSVVREATGRIRVSLRGDLFFGPNEEALKGDSSQYLQEIAEVVKLSVGTVHVVGYASADESQGTESFTLSTSRAADVADYLITEFEVDPKRVIITGRGAYHPELPSTSEANQSLNRRVEIVITNEI
ncbi:OmpA family protein [Pseudodesulfovibrio sp.]|nr:OmpA family protein [Pseudodesulfovibrio sp.]